jgi:heme-degrading monooxygenase HmoA
MFARRVSVHLQPNEAGEFSRTMENQVIPLLRKQHGFRDELVLVNAKASRAEAISLWDSQENADNFARGQYLQMLQILGNSIKDKPEVETFHVATTTLH